MSGIFTLLIDKTSGKITLPSEIPAQRITLKEYHTEFGTAANSKAQIVVLFQASWIPTSIVYHGENGDLSLTASSGRHGFPLITSNAITTIQSCDISFSLASPIPKTFDYNLSSYATGGDLITASNVFSHVLLVFEYTVGEII